MTDLKARVVAGLKWNLVGMVTQRLFAIAAMAVIARHVQPETFGLFALAFVAIDGLQLFQTLGLNSALIQRKELTPRITHTAFVMVTVTGAVMSGICYGLAPVFGTFFANDAVAGVIRALGVIFILGCLSRIPAALIWRDMRFRTWSLLQAAVSFLHNLSAVLLVLLVSTSVWSLVGAYVIKQLVYTALVLYISGYRPRIEFDRGDARQLMGFGRVMVVVALLSYLSSNADNVIVGRVLGTALLGYFTLAANLGDLVNRHLTGTLNELMFPAFARIQSEPERLRGVYVKSSRFIAVVAFPFGLFLLVAGEPLVLTLYGGQWQPAVPLVQLLGVTAILNAVTGCSSSLFRACGKPAYDLTVTLSRLLVRVPLLLAFASWWSLTGAVLAGLVSVAVFVPLTLALARRLAPFSLRELARGLSSPTLASLAMVAALLALRFAIRTGPLDFVASSPLATTAVLGGMGAVVFAGSLALADRPLSAEILQLALGARRGPTAALPS